MRLRALAPLLAITVLAVAAVACDDSEGGSPTPTGTEPPIVPTATVTPTTSPTTATPTTTPDGGPRTTGDAGLDAIVEAVDARDVGALSAFVEMQTVACTEALGIGGPPKCEEGQQEGEESTVFPLTSCEAEWTRFPVWRLGQAVHLAQGLYAALEAPDGYTLFDGAAPADTFLVFHADNHQQGFRLNLSDGRITSITLGCSDEFAFHEDPRTGEPFEVIAGPWDPQPADEAPLPATGQPALDETLARIATYDFGALFEDASRAMQEGATVACQERVQGPGGIECNTAKGEAEGTELHVFPSAYCEGSLSRSPSIPLQAFLSQAPVLHSIYEAPSESSGSPIYRNGSWWLVYELTAADAFPEAVRLNVGDDGAVLVAWYGCEGTVEAVSQGAGAPMDFRLE